MNRWKKYLLWPAAKVYGSGVQFRNKLYDWQIRKSVSFDVPVISLGNLSVGGTGKTPHTEYLIRLLQEKYKAGVLSRGYGRRTTGYALLGEHDSWRTGGDEPMQMKKKFPSVPIAICEDRVRGIPNLIRDHPEVEVVLLDDAFQHRRVQPGLSILLTEFSRPFTEDTLLPAGHLREPVHNAARADMIVVTKSPSYISDSDRNKMASVIRQRHDQPVFFSHLKYEPAWSLFHPEKKILHDNKSNLLLICGIANPAPLLNELSQLAPSIHMIQFRDHHVYSLRDVKNICDAFHSDQSASKVLLTTEKDGIRLLEFGKYFQDNGVEVYCIPVTVHFGNDTEAFQQMVFEYLNRQNTQPRVYDD